MDNYIVCFFGHRYVENHSVIEKKVEEIVRKIIRKTNHVEFLVGRNGEFDQIVSSVIRQVKKNTDTRAVLSC